MNLTGLHLLLTYRCNYECDHCFVWSGPNAVSKSLNIDDVAEILRQAGELRTVEVIFFEGGEPFLQYAVLAESIELATTLGFRTGIVSNGFWATTAEAAQKKLQPLAIAGLGVLQLSSDGLHGDRAVARRVKMGVAAAQALEIDTSVLAVRRPNGTEESASRGGSVMFRGRAADKLADGVPRQAWQSYTSCPYENLAEPARVHVDPFGNVHLCQGILMGNLFETPLVELVKGYVPDAHPIVGPLLEYGPAGLAEQHGLLYETRYADACHLCYMTRLRLMSRYPEWLGPQQVYGYAGA